MKNMNVPIYSPIESLHFIKSYLQGRRNLTWFKREKESGNPAPIKISSPGSKNNKRLKLSRFQETIVYRTF